MTAHADLTAVELAERLAAAKHAVLDARESDPELGATRARWAADEHDVAGLLREHTRRRLVSVGAPADLLGPWLDTPELLGEWLDVSSVDTLG